MPRLLTTVGFVQLGRKTSIFGAVVNANKNIATLTAQINNTIAAAESLWGDSSGTSGRARAAGGYLSAGTYRGGEGGGGGHAEDIHLNPGSSGWVGPGAGDETSGGTHTTIIEIDGQVIARVIEPPLDHLLGKRIALMGTSARGPMGC